MTNAGYTVVTHDHGLDYWTASGALEYAAARSLVLVGEAFSTIGAHQHADTTLLRAGFVYGLAPRAKLDAAVGFGVTDASPDLVLTTGVTILIY